MSIQVKTAADAVTGHLAWGVLTERDRVLVPGPVDWLLDVHISVEVLLASAQRDGRGFVERIAVDRAEIHSVRDRDGSTFAMLRLANLPQHQPNIGAPFTSDRLAAELATDADVWTVFERLGIVPTGMREFPVAEVLGPVVEWERLKRAGLVRVVTLESLDKAKVRWCCLFRTCSNCGECSGRWW